MSRLCAAESRCQGAVRGVPAPTEAEHVGLCGPCQEVGRRDIKALIYDYSDLEQHIPKRSVRREFVTGTREPSTPMDLEVESLQRGIWLLTTVWEEILREHAQLWMPPLDSVRDGYAVARAVLVLEPRIRLLASLPPAAIMLDGPDGPVGEQDGAEAILAFGRLHRLAQHCLGLTRVVYDLVGECPQCGECDLHREDGSGTVYCASCGHADTLDEYERYCLLMVEEAKKARSRRAA